MVPTPLILNRFADHPRIAAAVLGLISATGFQPFGLWPLALGAMAGLFVLLGKAGSRKEAVLIGWLFGVTHFTLGNFWIATAFTYQAQMPILLGWAAVPLISLYLAIYPAFALFFAHLIAGKRGGWLLAFAFSASWIVSEMLRAWVFTGYGWNPFGIVLLGGFDSPGLAVLAPWLGTYALSGLAVLLGCTGAMLLLRKQFVPLGLAAAVLTAVMFWPAGEGREGTLRYTLVQPDTRQEELNGAQFYEKNFTRTAGLSLPREPGERRIVLWPESGILDYLQDGYPQRYYDRMTALGSPLFARGRIGRTIGPGSMLLTGTNDLKIEKNRAIGAYNAVTVIDATGAIHGSYAKSHLVPFGEYLALRWLLEPLGANRLVAGSLDFFPGPGPRTLDLGDWGNAGIQICYEIVFSGEIVDPDNRPDYIFNPSNDGWFGSSGPPQHLAQARLRAIEEGLPVLRSTTTGISAVVDARGVVRAYAPMHHAQRLDGFVPPALPPTLFSKLGNFLPLSWAGLMFLIAGVALRRGEG